MHLLYTSCIIYERGTALYSEWVKSLKVVERLVSIQRAAFSRTAKIQMGKLINTYNNKQFIYLYMYA